MTREPHPVARAMADLPLDPVVEDADVVASRDLARRAGGQGRPLVLACDLTAALSRDSDMAGALWCLYEPETVAWHQRLEAAAGADVVVAASATPVPVLASPDGCDPERLAVVSGSIAARTAAPFSMGAVSLEGVDDLEPWRDCVSAMVEGFCSAAVSGLLVTGLAEAVAAEAVELAAASGLPVAAVLDGASGDVAARCVEAGAVAVGSRRAPGASAVANGLAAVPAVAIWPGADAPCDPFAPEVSMAGFGSDPEPSRAAALRSLADRSRRRASH